MGMGGAGAALSNEPATLYWNPAGLYFLDQIAADFTFQFRDLDWPENWGLSYANYSSSRRRGAGLGIYRSEIHSPDTLNFGDAVAVLLATVYPTPIGLPIGMAFKYVNENWEDAGRENYFTLDLGTAYELGGLYLGLAFQSVTQPQSQLHPYRVSLGASYRLGEFLTLAAQETVNDWSQIEDPDGADLRGGIEVSPGGLWSLRAGRWERPDQNYWTAGLGLGSTRGGARLHFAYHWPDGNDGEKGLFISYVYSPR
jgi:hypothetical protein